MRILTAENIRAAENAANANGISFSQMMEAAGRGCAEHILQGTKPSTVAVLCGKGKNGGDGLVIARVLAEHGYGVTVINLFREASDPLSESMREKLPASVRQVFAEAAAPYIEEAAILVDAIFGIGFTGEVREPVRSVLLCANRAQAYTYAIDIPSGLSENDCGGICLRADETLTMLCYKPVHAYKPTAARCGRVTTIDIGFAVDTYAPPGNKSCCTEAKEVASLLKKRPFDANKGTFGNALLLMGSYLMPGAASLAAMGALHTGAGLVTLAFPESAYAAIAPQNPECVLKPMSAAPDGSFAAENAAKIAENCRCYTAAAAGCGMTTGEGAKECLLALVRSFPGTLIIDADGINCLSSHIDILNEAPGTLLLTPHPGEMARLTGLSIPAVNADRESIARSFAAAHGVVLLLKGANTVIALPDGTVHINPTGNPGMARGGSGDLLTGMLVSLAAQGLTAGDAAVAGAYLHGLAGDFAARQYTELAATVRHTARCIPAALSFVLSQKD